MMANALVGNNTTGIGEMDNVYATVSLNSKSIDEQISITPRYFALDVSLKTTVTQTMNVVMANASNEIRVAILKKPAFATSDGWEDFAMSVSLRQI